MLRFCAFAIVLCLHPDRHTHYYYHYQHTPSLRFRCLRPLSRCHTRPQRLFHLRVAAAPLPRVPAVRPQASTAQVRVRAVGSEGLGTRQRAFRARHMQRSLPVERAALYEALVEKGAAAAGQQCDEPRCVVLLDALDHGGGNRILQFNFAGTAIIIIVAIFIRAVVARSPGGVCTTSTGAGTNTSTSTSTSSGGTSSTGTSTGCSARALCACVTCYAHSTAASLLANHIRIRRTRISSTLSGGSATGNGVLGLRLCLGKYGVSSLPPYAHSGCFHKRIARSIAAAEVDRGVPRRQRRGKHD